MLTLIKTFFVTWVHCFWQNAVKLDFSHTMCSITYGPKIFNGFVPVRGEYFCSCSEQGDAVSRFLKGDIDGKSVK